MANFLYVDNSNLWIEGMRVAGVTSGLAADLGTALRHNITDGSWRINFGRLQDFAGGQRSEIGRAVLYGSRLPSSDSLWHSARQQGF